MAFLSATLLSYNRSTTVQVGLRRDQAVVVGFLNRAKALAIEKYHRESRSCVFGVHFTAGSPTLTLFQDLKPAGDVEFGCRDRATGLPKNDFIYDATSDSGEQVEEYRIDRRSTVKLLDASGSPIGGASIMFVPPDLTMTIRSGDDLDLDGLGDEIAGGAATISIQDLATGVAVQVTVSAAGQITAN